MAERDALPLPLDIRARIAELELELSEGEFWISRLNGGSEMRVRQSQTKHMQPDGLKLARAFPLRVYIRCIVFVRALMDGKSRTVHERP